MKRWYTLLEIIQFPLKMLFVAIALMCFGDFFINPNITPYLSITNEYFILLCEVLKYLGSFLIGSFPMLLVIKVLSKRYEDSVPAFVGVVSYIVFHIVTMFVNEASLPAYCYQSIMGLQVDLSGVFSLTGQGIRYPLFTGVIATIIVAFITRKCYLRSRRRFTYGVLGFIDNDSWSLITSTFLTMVAGVLVSLGWPFFIDFLENIFTFIAADIYNPGKLFAYGIAERILTVFNLQDLIHQPFWYGNLGGSWMDNFGQTFTGDVTIWTTLAQQNVNTMGYGRFITPYYVMNCFAIPGMLIACWALHTDKMERRRMSIFFVFAILLSIMAGTLVPIELFLLVAAPFLFVAHVAAMGGLYAIFGSMSVSLGYSFTGSISQAMPGTIISMLPYFGNPAYTDTLLKILMVGVAYFVLYFSMTMLYYKVLSGDYLDIGADRRKKDIFLEAIGGVKNVRIINSSLNKITLHLFDPTVVDYELLKELHVYKTAETRAGLMMEFGPCSTILKDGVRKEMKKYQEERKAKPTVQEDGTNVQK